MDIITGYTGEKHVTSEQDRDINIGICGRESYVLQTGTRMEAEVSSNNEIKIRDGVIIHQGCAASIKKNTYDPITIMNGSQGMKRIDLIVARYERNNDTGIESMNLIALQGTPEETNPAVPEYVSGDIQAGDAVADMPMYQVIIDGLNITEVKIVCKEVGNLAQMKNEIDELNKKSLGQISGQSDLHFERQGSKVTVYGRAILNAQSITITLPYAPNHLLMFPVVGLESSQNPTNGYVGRGLCSKNSKSCEIKLSGANTFAPVNFSYCTDDEL